ncbi:MAG: single-stranded-DNA-specific exonuclease RecJ [Desulfamplus sp.]|nr:single-stranded-DNA-specific exonuclease RecJ [Desulfamplus sp.]
MRIKDRTINKEVYDTCIEHAYPEIVARIIAGRTDTFDKNIFQFTLDAIKPADIMVDCTKAAKRIVEAIYKHETILFFTDYDVDGCTSMAIMYETLHHIFGVPNSKIIRLTGNRTVDGYGLTDTIADKIINFKPTIVITADAGASDGQRIKRLADAGIDVIVTDHHIVPKEGVPEAAFAVVNPKREQCQYDDNIAGCGVVWLLMTAISREMNCNIEQKRKIHQLLDLVALGTVADLVPLNSVVNRYFVKKGLEFMNRKVRPCWQVALNGRAADTGYLAFQLAPRINASSRMSCEAITSIDFLTHTNHEDIAQAYRQLDIFNTQRQKIEKEMFNAAKASIFINSTDVAISEPILIYYSKNNHPGVQGIVAGKLTENFGIPVVMLADIGNGVVTGSGRAGQFLHIRDALQTFDDRFSGILIAYGGHKAAAGFKLHKDNIWLFKEEFSKIVAEQLKTKDTTPYINTDGSLKGVAHLQNQINLETYYNIEALRPFGMGFPAPLFYDKMVATDVKVIGKNPIHLSMSLDGVRAAFFNALSKPGAALPINSGEIVDVIYTLNLNSWQGRERLEIIIKKIESCES